MENCPANLMIDLLDATKIENTYIYYVIPLGELGYKFNIMFKSIYGA